MNNEVVINTELNAKPVEESLEKINKGVKSGVKNLLKYTIGVTSIFAAIKKLRDAVKEGLKNLSQFDGGNNSVNGAMSNLVSSVTQLKNSLATAFAPILTTIEPILTRFIDMLSEAATTVGQFFAALTGSGTFTRAVKVQEDYAASLSKTGKNAKKAKGQLAGFYDLNNLTTKTDTGSATSDPSKMFETVQIESQISGFAERVLAIINPIKESIAGWALDLNVEPMIESLGRLKDATAPILETLGEGFKYILDNVLEPFGSFAVEDAFPASVEAVAAAFGALTSLIEPVKPILDKLYQSTIKPFASFLGSEFVKNMGAVKDTFSKLSEMFQAKSESISKIFNYLSNMVTLFATKVKLNLQFTGGIVREFLNVCVSVVGRLIDILTGLIDFITGVFTGDWTKAWNGIKDVFRGIVNLIIDIFEGAINMIVGGLNNIAIDIPDFVPGVGGKHIGFNIPKVNWPRLATGTVVPRQSREFAAILGDNNRETEVVSPLSTMKQAFMEALAESGRVGAGQNVTVVLEGDANTFFRVMQKKADEYLDRTGNPAFAY